MFLSCRTEQGIADLLQIIEKKLGLHRELRSYLIPHEEYKLVVKIRKEGCLAEESPVDDWYDDKSISRAHACMGQPYAIQK